MQLVFEEEPPSYPFQNQEFQISLCLCDENGFHIPPIETIGLGLILCYEHDDEQVEKNAYRIREKSLKLDNNGSCKASVTIISEDLVDERKALKIKAFIKFGLDSQYEVFSSSFYLVRHKLEIEYQEKWDKTFYKDMGGKDSCLKARIKLVDKNKKLITNRTIKITTTLHRNDNNAQVSDILTLLNNAHGDNIIEMTRGYVDVKARITDVSMHHGNSDFYLSFKAQGAINIDIAPIHTIAVNVKSKKNHKRKLTSSNSSNNIPKVLTENSMPPSPSLPPIPTPSMADDLKKCKQDAQDLIAFAASATGEEARAALSGYAHFLAQVFDSLESMQWRAIGYAPDYAHAHYLFDNPNDTIVNLMHSFNTITNSIHGNTTTNFEPKKARSISPLPPPSSNYVSKVLSEDDDVANDKNDDQDAGLPPFVPIEKSWNQQSSLYVPEMPPTKAESSAADALHALQQPTVKRPRMSAGQGGEECIDVVFAKKFKPYGASFDLGFPCYDNKGCLLGLYQECSGDDLIFVSFESTKLNQHDIDLAHDCYPIEFQKKSQCIIKRSDFPDLHDLKEHVKSYNESKVFCSIDMDCEAIEKYTSIPPRTIAAGPFDGTFEIEAT